MSRPLVLVDGQNLLFRCHYAHVVLSTRDGKPTSVLYGFPKTLFGIYDVVGGCDIVICWDSVEYDPKGSHQVQWRRKLAPTVYKANRTISEETKRGYSQLPELRRLLGILAFPEVHIAGLEADDLIGLIGSHLLGESLVERVIVFSNDQDFYQLLDTPGFQLMKSTDKGAEVIDAKKIFSKCGVQPNQYARWKALVGDASDNYKGIPGIGPKRAQTLLADGLDPSLPEFKMLPRKVQVKYSYLESTWKDVHLCHIFSQIPREPNAFIPERLIRPVLERFERGRNRGRTPKLPLDKLRTSYLQFCGDYELSSLVADRHRAFRYIRDNAVD